MATRWFVPSVICEVKKELTAIEARNGAVERSLCSSISNQINTDSANINQKTKKISGSAEEECANCASVGGRDGAVLSKCSKCSIVAYCSRSCQIQHWRDGGHKGFCLSLVERSARAAGPSTKVAYLLGVNEDLHNCVICNEKMDTSNACALPCEHRFHTACVSNMRQFSVSQACPLCRAPLTSIAGQVIK